MKLPKNAERVFKGMMFDVYQWDQELYDGTTARFELIQRTPTVKMIVVRGDKILVPEEEQPGKGLFPWLPGGRIEDGESSRDAAVRELMEEHGLIVGKMDNFREYSGFSKILHRVDVFLVREFEESGEQYLDGGEKIYPRWLSFDEFLQTTRHPKFAVPAELKFELYEALVDQEKYKSLKKEIFWE